MKKSMTEKNERRDNENKEINKKRKKEKLKAWQINKDWIIEWKNERNKKRINMRKMIIGIKEIKNKLWIKKKENRKGIYEWKKKERKKRGQEIKTRKERTKEKWLSVAKTIGKNKRSIVTKKKKEIICKRKEKINKNGMK